MYFFFFHSKYLFCHPFDSAARSSRTTPTRYAPSDMDVTVLTCEAQYLPNTTSPSEAYEVIEHSKTILDKIYHCVT